MEHIDSVHAHTHEPRPTKMRYQVSPEALKLVEELRDVCRNEEAWAIAQKYLDEYVRDKKWSL
jgi:hypothetical protein